MDKCWFVLKQVHYPPPDLPETGIGTANGSISLGHIIPDPVNLDGVINRSEEGITFTSTARIRHTRTACNWNNVNDLEAGLSSNIQVSMGTGVPVSTALQSKLAFKRTSKNHESFDFLDSYIVDVDRKFISRILEKEEVAAHIERIKGVQLLGIGGRWSIWMITGIIVARGAKRAYGDSRKIEARTSASVNAGNVAPGAVASGAVAANFASKKGTSMLIKESSDYVWAVRLTKIWKAATEKDWDFRTVEKGSTFSMNGEKPWREEIQKALAQELPEMGDFQTLELPDEEGMIVLQ
ncbi:hypothetical protein TrVFT333_011036 [Trichoderma virens FT-333]|nr:hypothetical protein TrVFT333_011036 [Trichoderma virens FT-333]